MRPLVPLRLRLGAALVAILLATAAGAADDAAKPALGKPDAAKPDAAKPVPAALMAPGSDRSVIYKFDPLSKKYTAVARKDLTPQQVYQRYSPGVGKWVWSKAAADGTLRYAFGPGSSQPAALFDMPATSEERTTALEKQSPELAKRLAINGAKPSLRLGDARGGEQSLDAGRRPVSPGGGAALHRAAELSVVSYQW